VKITPLDSWINSKTGARGASSLHGYQLELFRETLDFVKGASRFYSEHLSSTCAAGINRLDDVRHIPFTLPEMLMRHPHDFVCVPPDDIGRIVTLPTSGTTGSPKRIFFTPGDQELTLDFFHHGMTTLADENDRVMIFLPGKSEGSVGRLLRRSLERFGCEGVLYGPIYDYDDALQALAASGATIAAGLPAQLFALSCIGPGIRLKSVLLCSDHVSQAVSLGLTKAWGCEVFSHYGMTESGLGGGVDCSAHSGYHMREADLLFEIIDPVSEAPVPDGERGEIVFTTLTRRGMPLVRYRTGDMSYVIPGRCPCGSGLRRFGHISGRIPDMVGFRADFTLSMPILDEILFCVPGLLGFTADIDDDGGRDLLTITIFSPGNEQAVQEAGTRIRNDRYLGEPIAGGLFEICIRHGGAGVLTYGNEKRNIVDRRQKRRTR